MKKTTFFTEPATYLKNLTRTLGRDNSALQVSPLGLGCMGMSESYYGPAEEAKCIETIRQAYYEAGVTFFDTADIYGVGENERLVGKAIKDFREKIVLATKFGLVKDPNSNERLVKANREYVFAACNASLERLQTSYIDLLYLHRLDPQVPIEETVGAMAELVKQGKVRHIGLSEVSESILRRAHAVFPITALQTEYSLCTRVPAENILPVCEELGIGYVAYSPLGRGILSGSLDTTVLDAKDKRRNLPRFTGDNFDKNKKLVADLTQLANDKGVELPVLALAWLLHKNDNLVPLFGTKNLANVLRNSNAVKVKLDKQEIALIESIATTNAIQGDRYNKDAMARLG